MFKEIIDDKKHSRRRICICDSLLGCRYLTALMERVFGLSQHSTGIRHSENIYITVMLKNIGCKC